MMMSPLIVLAVVLPMVFSCAHVRLSNPPVGQPFYIIQTKSGKSVHPLGGSANPCDNTKLVLHSCGFGERRIQFVFERCPCNPYGYGYLKQVTSGKYVHPLGGSQNPCDNTALVFHSGKHGACLFGFGTDGNIYQYSSGKTWHPLGGSTCPGDNTVLVLHSGAHAATKFYYKLVSSYPPALQLEQQVEEQEQEEQVEEVEEQQEFEQQEVEEQEVEEQEVAEQLE